MFFKLLLSALALLLMTSVTHAKVQRISSISKNLGQVEKIYLNDGLISVIELPEAVAEIRIGNQKDFKIIPSEKFPNELTLFLAKGTRDVFTNLIVRTGRGVYVFDLISSRSNHQDYLKVTGAYGRPVSNNDQSSKLVQKVLIEGRVK